MKSLTIATTVLFAAALTHLSTGQVATPTPDPLLELSFDVEVGGWQSADPTTQPTITTDANVIRDERGGVLEYQYTPALGQFTGLVAPVEAGLAGGKSLRFWLRTTDHALMAAILTEADGSEYVAMMSGLPGDWQEVALDFGEFQLGDDSSDENGQLDPEQIRSMGLADIMGVLAQAVMQQPFLIPPELHSRILWLDDFSVRTDSFGPRWQEIEVDGKPAVRLESFERSPLQWFVLAGKGIEVAYDQDHVAHGDFSLRITYDLPPGKLVGALTGLAGVPLTGMKRLSLSVMSEVPTMLLVQLKERDESEYNTTFEVAAGDALKPLEIELAQLALGDESTDENGRLDLDQVKEFVVVDISMMTENPVQLNTLWIDDIVFSG